MRMDHACMRGIIRLVRCMPRTDEPETMRMYHGHWINQIYAEDQSD